MGERILRDGAARKLGHAPRPKKFTRDAREHKRPVHEHSMAFKRNQWKCILKKDPGKVAVEVFRPATFDLWQNPSALLPTDPYVDSSHGLPLDRCPEFRKARK